MKIQGKKEKKKTISGLHREWIPPKVGAPRRETIRKKVTKGGGKLAGTRQLCNRPDAVKGGLDQAVSM